MKRRIMKSKKKINENLLIVDGNNTLMRSYFKFKNKGFSNGKVNTGAVYGFFKILHSNIVRFKITQVVVCFDFHRSDIRKKAYPEYKAQRKKISEDWDDIFKVQFPIIKRILRNMGITYIWDNKEVNDLEADDYLALVYQKNIVQNTFLLSSDEDFVQLLAYPNIKLINSAKDELVSANNCKKVYGYKPEQAVDIKILCGDTSDNINGIKGVGPKTALKILEKGTAKDYMESKGLAELYNRNRLLMDLFYYLSRVKVREIPYHEKGGYNSRNLLMIYDTYQLKSFMAPEFTKVFKNLKTYKHE